MEVHKEMNASALNARSARFLPAIRELRKDSRGLAAIEFAMIASFLAISLLQVADLALYLFDELQVENAAEMGAQAVYANCTYQQLPVVNNCSGWSSKVTTAVQSTELGTHVTLVAGSPSEGYYCVNSSGALQFMNATSSAKPADCTAAGVSTNNPGDWVKVRVTYTYAPMFTFTVANLFSTTISETAFMRLG